MIRNYCTYDKHMLRPVCKGNNSVVSCKKCGAVVWNKIAAITV